MLIGFGLLVWLPAPFADFLSQKRSTSLPT